MIKDSFAFVVPAFNPNHDLIEIVQQLVDRQLRHVIVIDDGSQTGSTSIFEHLQQFSNVTLLKHPQNMGKGAALKTAFKFIADQIPEVDYVVTLDADGQHMIDDIMKVAEEGFLHRQSMVMGCREFGKSVPFRSKFGNVVSRNILRVFNGIKLSDTQTGLRGLPIWFAKKCLEIKADRYEFELECIMVAKRCHVQLLEVRIQTIYLDDNASSHFRPLVDSYRINKVFVKHASSFWRYLPVSIACFLIDIGFFTLLISWGANIFESSYGARAISGFTNYNLNRFAVFGRLNQPSYFQSLVGYIGLMFAVATSSAFLIHWAVPLLAPLSLTTIKIMVDTGLFVMSYFLQRFLVFRKV